MCIALVGLSLTLINYGIDEITNPRLRKEKELEKAVKAAEKEIALIQKEVMATVEGER